MHFTPHLPLVLHTSPVGHVPQLTLPPPHALLIVPHSRPMASHSRGTSGGPQRFAMPSVAHDCPVGQSPQKINPPQPSEMYPQSAFCAGHATFGSAGTHVPPTDFAVGSQRL